MKTNLILIWTVLSMILISNSISAKSENEQGSTNVVKKEINVQAFHKIDMTNVDKVEYTQTVDTDPYIVVEIDENLMKYVKVSSTDGVLKVNFTKADIKPTKFNIQVNSKQLYEVAVNGKGSFVGKDKICSQNMNIVLNGNGDITFENLITRNAMVSSEGEGNINLQGMTSRSTIIDNGVGTINTDNFVKKASNKADQRIFAELRK